MIAQRRVVAAAVVAAAFAFVPAGSADASPVVLAGPEVWNSWTTSDLLSGSFWANWSYDRNGYANVGYFMSATYGSNVPGFYDASPGSTMPYLGSGSTTFALVLTDPVQPTQFTHLLSVTGWRWEGVTDDEFGLYNLATGERHALLNASDPLGSTVPFYSAGTYAFYLTSG
jgi:hypothetical protein